MPTVTMTVKGQIVIPAELRRRYHFRAGSRLTVVDSDGGLVILPPLKNPAKDTRGLFKGQGSATAFLLSWRRAEHRHDQRKLLSR